MSRSPAPAAGTEDFPVVMELTAFMLHRGSEPQDEITIRGGPARLLSTVVPPVASRPSIVMLAERTDRNANAAAAEMYVLKISPYPGVLDQEVANHQLVGYHENVVQLAAYAIDVELAGFPRKVSWIATPYMSAGDGFDVLKSIWDTIDSDGLTEVTQLRVLHIWLVIARGCTMALIHIHRRGLVHLDVKPDNTFWDEHAAATVCLLGDLGCGQTFKQLRECGRAVGGTFGYMAPEVERRRNGEDVEVGPRADGYSLARTLGLFACGAWPKWEGGVVTNFPDWMPPQLADATAGLLNPDPKLRLPLAGFWAMVEPVWRATFGDRTNPKIEL